jgi:DNA polymerase III gamma/tau subunit
MRNKKQIIDGFLSAFYEKHIKGKKNLDKNYWKQLGFNTEQAKLLEYALLKNKEAVKSKESFIKSPLAKTLLQIYLVRLKPYTAKSPNAAKLDVLIKANQPSSKERRVNRSDLPFENELINDLFGLGISKDLIGAFSLKNRKKAEKKLKELSKSKSSKKVKKKKTKKEAKNNKLSKSDTKKEKKKKAKTTKKEVKKKENKTQKVNKNKNENVKKEENKEKVKEKDKEKNEKGKTLKDIIDFFKGNDKNK